MVLLVRLQIQGVRTEGKGALVKPFVGKCSLPFSTLSFWEIVHLILPLWQETLL